MFLIRRTGGTPSLHQVSGPGESEVGYHVYNREIGDEVAGPFLGVGSGKEVMVFHLHPALGKDLLCFDVLPGAPGTEVGARVNLSTQSDQVLRSFPLYRHLAAEPELRRELQGVAEGHNDGNVDTT